MFSWWMASSSPPDTAIWEGKDLKKGFHAMSSWKERELKLHEQRIDYFDVMLCLRGSIPLVVTTKLEVINESLVNIHTIGRKEKEKW